MNGWACLNRAARRRIGFDSLVREVISICFEKIGEVNASETTHPSDSNHEVFNAKLKGGAVLHRFYNRKGVLYSAIYKEGVEVMNNPREREYAMIAYYQATYEERFLEE